LDGLCPGARGSPLPSRFFTCTGRHPEGQPGPGRGPPPLCRKPASHPNPQGTPKPGRPRAAHQAVCRGVGGGTQDHEISVSRNNGGGGARASRVLTDRDNRGPGWVPPGRGELVWRVSKRRGWGKTTTSAGSARQGQRYRLHHSHPQKPHRHTVAIRSGGAWRRWDPVGLGETPVYAEGETGGGQARVCSIFPAIPTSKT